MKTSNLAWVEGLKTDMRKVINVHEISILKQLHYVIYLYVCVYKKILMKTTRIRGARAPKSL